MRRSLLVSLAVFTMSHALHADGLVAVVDRPSTEQTNSPYVANRAPLQPGALIKLPVASFKPGGWLKVALERQRDGLTGHLGEISKWLIKKDNAWLRSDGKGDFGWEEVPYWLRGYARIAYTLNDPKMLEETKVWIEAALRGQRENGDFGPVIERNGKRDLWAQMLMLQILQAWHEHSNDPRVLPFMTNYFKWQLTIPDNRFLEDYWERSRGGDNLASVYWLYNRTGDEFLLDLASKIDRNTADWRQFGNLPNWHVVNIAECFRAPATFSLQSKRKFDLDASYRAHNLAREKYGQVPGGMFGADENAREGYVDPHQAAETCSFVEQIWSNLLMSEITGDPFWAANTEDVAYNTLPAAFTEDYKALRYLTAPNQVVSDAMNHAPGVANEGPFMLMNPFSSRCCQHNHTSGWINFAEHAWMATPDGGLAAVLYAPGEVTAKVGANGATATIVTETKYPFEETVTLTVKSADGAFPMYLRVPKWADGATLSINGKEQAVTLKTGGYAKLDNTWKSGDVIALTLPMKLNVRTWERNKDSVSVDYGPLTFSLKIDETYNVVDSIKTAIGDSGWQDGADQSKWPTREILPSSEWNYGLILDKANPAKSIQIVKRDWPKDDYPFTNASTPIELKVKGKAIPTWTLDEHGLCGVVPQSPVKSEEPVTDLTLLPMGGARLRVSAFPTVAE